MCLAASALPAPVIASNVPRLSASEKVAEAIRRAARSMPGKAGAKLQSLLSPEALAMVAGVIVVWVASHAVGVGEAVDVLLLATGLIFVGREAVDAIGHLIDFGRLSLGAQTEADLDSAGQHLAIAVSIIGINTVIVLLTRGGIKAHRGRYKPSIKGDPALPPGEGWTNKYGDVRYSAAGSAQEQALVRYHEQVHSFFSPKLMKFREQRANMGMAAYEKSAFLRYLEEALAESYAQLRVNGIKGLPAGIRFPIANGYVTLRAVATEAAVGLAFGTVTVGGIVYAVYVESAQP
jgi:hypothetical protein